MNEHYVPKSYLRLFAPTNEGLISQYSLVEKHGGGDLRPPSDEFSIDNAASKEGFADGWLEQDEITRMENGGKQVFERLRETPSLDEDGIVTIAQYVMLQKARTPSARRHYEMRRSLSGYLDNSTDLDGLSLADGWEEVLRRSVTEGHNSQQHMGWLLVKNETEIPFITSDNPVAGYFSQDFDAVENAATQLEGREMYYPIGEDYLLVFLDPSRFDVPGQYPSTEIECITVTDAADVHGVNQLQIFSAFQEVFGPVDCGSYLEGLVDELVTEFEDEAYIRGYTGDVERLELAYWLSNGLYQSPWYQNYGKEIIEAEQMSSHAIWEHEHDISFVDDLRRDTPVTEYWDEILE